MKYQISILSPLLSLLLAIMNSLVVQANEINESSFDIQNKQPSTIASDLAEETNAEPADNDDNFVPTDPTNIIPSITLSYERTEFSDAQGNSNIYAIEGWIPLSNQDLLTIEGKLVNVNFSSSAMTSLRVMGCLFSISRKPKV